MSTIITNTIENHLEAIFWIGLITVIAVVAIFATLHTQATNERFDDNGRIIDKWATEDHVYCLVQVHDVRYKTYSGCEPKIVGDHVEVTMNKNLETFKLSLVSIN